MQARPILQNMMCQALRRRGEALPQGHCTQEVLQKLMSDVAAAGSDRSKTSSQGLLERGKETLRDKHKLSQVETWMQVNNDGNVARQPAFASFLAGCKSAFCVCVAPDEWDSADDPAACDFHTSSHTVNDLVWGMNKYLEMDGTIPADMSVLGSAALMLWSAWENKPPVPVPVTSQSAEAAVAPVPEGSGSGTSQTAQARATIPWSWGRMHNEVNP